MADAISYLVNAGGRLPREDIEYMQGANPCLTNNIELLSNPE
ncbi:hypothetical protein [Leuconostoc carnosum]|nr:hypothetical protein [Leuconostoc carnosum]SPJ44085.1 hypothetical protein LCAC16_80169 [Leuconostoc carnosum]